MKTIMLLLIEKFQESFERRFSQTMYCLHKHNRPSLSGKIDEQFYRLEQTLEPIKTDVIRLRHDAQEDKNDINELLQDRDNTYTQMHQLEKDVERLEIHSRQANLKFFGILEPDPRENRTDINELVDALNCFSARSSWRTPTFRARIVSDVQEDKPGDGTKTSRKGNPTPTDCNPLSRRR